jgi:hypothetical protein
MGDFPPTRPPHPGLKCVRVKPSQGSKNAIGLVALDRIWEGKAAS